VAASTCGGGAGSWRPCAVTAPRAVLDLATGSGDVAFALARGLAAGSTAILGMDFCQPMLDEAETKKKAAAGEARYARVRFQPGDGMALPLADASFDAVTIAFGCATWPTAPRRSVKCAACCARAAACLCWNSRNLTPGSGPGTCFTFGACCRGSPEPSRATGPLMSINELQYELTRKLAEGGMGMVYEAVQRGSGNFRKIVAIKLIREEYSSIPEFQKNFIGEARLVADLIHTNIVQTYHLGQIGGQYFMTMEFVTGVNLEQFIDRHNELGRQVPLDMAVFIASRVCRGLSYAHAKRDRRAARSASCTATSTPRTSCSPSRAT
jgi:SAM-dependent methyltransferase